MALAQLVHPCTLSPRMGQRSRLRGRRPSPRASPNLTEVSESDQDRSGHVGLTWNRSDGNLPVMITEPDDDLDAKFFLDLLKAVADRQRTHAKNGGVRTVSRRAIELVWEKPREVGPTYGKYRLDAY